MLPKTINTQDFLNFFKEKGYIIQEKNNDMSIFTINYILTEYDNHLTQKDIKKELHKLIEKEVKLYLEVTKMTPSALTDHIISKLFSNYGLNLIKTYIELKEEE